MSNSLVRAGSVKLRNLGHKILKINKMYKSVKYKDAVNTTNIIVVT